MTVRRQACCSCGDLSLEVEGQPVLVGACHCQQCQRRTGSAFGYGAFFKADRVTRSSGAASVFERTGESGATVRFHFCPRCGSTVYWTRSTRPELITVAAGAFADPSFPAPTRSAWTQWRHRWLQLPCEDHEQFWRNP